MYPLLHDRPKLLDLARRQIFLPVLAVRQEQENEVTPVPVIDDSQSATFAFARQFLAKLAQPAAAANEIARVGTEQQRQLQAAKAFRRQQRFDLLGEDRGFDEFHMADYTSLT
ncbi:MAG: hypothetical protein HZA91_11780 [Verrucomicrobia bacterium]|nr:hypothetical protein [Verrucomicrobiota bacterium]